MLFFVCVVLGLFVLFCYRSLGLIQVVWVWFAVGVLWVCGVLGCWGVSCGFLRFVWGLSGLGFVCFGLGCLCCVFVLFCFALLVFCFVVTAFGGAGVCLFWFLMLGLVGFLGWCGVCGFGGIWWVVLCAVFLVLCCTLFGVVYLTFCCLCCVLVGCWLGLVVWVRFGVFCWVWGVVCLGCSVGFISCLCCLCCLRRVFVIVVYLVGVVLLGWGFVSVLFLLVGWWCLFVYLGGVVCLYLLGVSVFVLFHGVVFSLVLVVGFLVLVWFVGFLFWLVVWVWFGFL